MNKLKVLIIEDNTADLRLLEELLAAQTYLTFDILSAETLAEGLDIINTETLEAVLLDLGLPDSQGLLSLHAVQRLNKSFPIIVITGLKEEEIAIEAIRSGAQEYFVKGEIDGRILARAIMHARERYNIQKKLREYESIVESTDEIIISQNLDGTIITWNKAAEKTYGYTAEEMIGKSISVLYPQGKGTEIYTMLKAIKSGAHTLKLETKHLTKDGKPVSVSVIASPVKMGKDYLAGIAMIATDVSSQQLVQQELAIEYRVATITNEAKDIYEAGRSTIESVCEILEWNAGEFWMSDAQINQLRNTSTWVSNDNFQELIKINSDITFELGEGLPGKIWELGRVFHCKIDAIDMTQSRRAALDKLGLHFALGFPVLYKNRLLGVMIFYNNEIPSPDRGLAEMFFTIGSQLGVFINRKNIEREGDVLQEQLRIKNEELEAQVEFLRQASQAKSMFLANMSHELRTPLNSIIGFTELMYKGKVGPVEQAHKEYLGEVATNAHHLLHLINDILDLTKIESGKMECHPEPVNVANLLDEVKTAMSLSIAEKKIKYEVIIDPLLTGSVSTDPYKFKQIIFNYLSNAVKFNSVGGKILVRLAPENTGYFRVSVTDSGNGISKNDIDKLFVNFGQLSISYSKTHQGMGLGLALSRHIAEIMGGRVGVDSEPGKGSCFYVILPLIHSEIPAKEIGTQQKN